MEYEQAGAANDEWKSRLTGAHPAFMGCGMRWHVARHYPLGDLRILSKHEDGSYWWHGLPVYVSREVAAALDSTFQGL